MRLAATALITTFLIPAVIAAEKHQRPDKSQLPLKIKASLETAVRTNSLFPSNTPINIELLEAGTMDQSLPPSLAYVAPIKATLPDTANTYCLLVIASKETSNQQAISSIPLSDACKGWKLLSRQDVNDDGFADFVFEETLPSNRYDSLVTEPRVFISDNTTQSYCFSEKGSNSADMLDNEDRIPEELSKLALRCPTR